MASITKSASHADVPNVIEKDNYSIDRVRAIGALIWKDPERILASASRLRGFDQEVEIRLRGSSMGAAIPQDSLLRIRFGTTAPVQIGEVVAFVANAKVFVHRVVYRGRGTRAKDYIVTQGDACLCPDPPMNSDRVLGTVTECFHKERWAPPGLPISKIRADSVVSRTLQRVVAWVMELDIRLAQFVARLATNICNTLPHGAPVGGFTLNSVNKNQCRR